MEHRPLFHWQQRFPWVKYLLPPLTVVVIAGLWAASVTDDSRLWLSQIGLMNLVFFPHWLLTHSLYVLTDRAFVVHNRFGQPTWVPLATAELITRGARAVLRWKDGRRRPTLALPRALTPAVKAALTHVPPDSPTTGKAAAQTLAVGLPLVEHRWMWGVIGGILLLFGLAIWLNQPLILLPLVALPYLVQRYSDDWALVLTETDLWLVARKAPAVQVPRTAITGVAPANRASVTILTTLPDLPRIQAAEYQSADLIRALRRTEVPAAPKAESHTPTAQARCSLCGRLLTGTAHPGDVHFCDPCSNKARHQATEAGHGLTGKEPKPM